jgi:hypothetical protein
LRSIFRTPFRDDFRYQPGQYLTFRASLEGEDVRRSYSLCSAPSDDEWRVAVKKVEGGLFSRMPTSDSRPKMYSNAPPDGRFFPDSLSVQANLDYVFLPPVPVSPRSFHHQNSAGTGTRKSCHPHLRQQKGPPRSFSAKKLKALKIAISADFRFFISGPGTGGCALAKRPNYRLAPR